MNIDRTLFKFDATLRNNQNKKVAHIMVLVTYCLLQLVMIVFHEPWYDEAEAWQIARCASVEEIIFTIPHYEGHPPLWHLLLAIPAKLGMPYELSLSLIALAFSGTAVALFLSDAPFPEWVKIFAPFTYFAFYQYGVIARPYCMLMLAFVMMAITWKKRNEQPISFVMSMVFLCLTSSYGIIIAGGISIVWLLEILREKQWRFFTDNRTITLCFLLVLALLLIVEVIPFPGTSATTGRTADNEIGTLMRRMLFCFLMMLPESSLTMVEEGDFSIQNVMGLRLSACLGAAILGLIIWALIIYYGRRKKTLLWFLVPYCLFALFASIVYFYAHHIGIGLFLFMFWAWITMQNPEVNSEDKISTANKSIAIIMAISSIIISCSWTLLSVIYDIQYDYYPARNSAKFIKDTGLDNYNIMTSWREDKDENGNIVLTDTNSLGGAVALFPYFEHNIIYNAHGGIDELAYDTHKNASDVENKDNLKEWKEKGYPDVLYNSPNLSTVFGDINANMPEYVLVYERPYDTIWKGNVDLYAATIYVTKEVQQELGLTELEKNLEYYIHIR